MLNWIFKLTGWKRSVPLGLLQGIQCECTYCTVCSLGLLHEYHITHMTVSYWSGPTVCSLHILIEILWNFLGTLPLALSLSLSPSHILAFILPISSRRTNKEIWQNLFVVLAVIHSIFVTFWDPISAQACVTHPLFIRFRVSEVLQICQILPTALREIIRGHSRHQDKHHKHYVRKQSRG